MITVNLLLEKLKYEGIEHVNPSERTYVAVIRNQGALDLGNVSIINVVTGEEVRNGPCELKGTYFVIGQDFSPEKLDGAEAVVFPEDTEISGLIASANAVIAEYNRYRDYVLRLETISNVRCDLLEILDLFASYYNNLVCLGDRSGNIIYTKNLKTDFRDWDETLQNWIQKGYIPYEFSKKSGAMARADAVLHSPEPVIHDGQTGSKYKRMAYRIRNSAGQYTNYLSVIAVYSAYQYFDADVLKHTADTISAKYSSVFQEQLESPRSNVFKLLLEGKILDKNSVEDRLRSCHIHPAGFYKVAFICSMPGTAGRSEADLKSLWNTIRYEYPACLSTYCDDAIVLLLQSKNEEEMEEVVGRLNSFLKNIDQHVSYSRVYEDILETSLKYHEAKLTSGVGSAVFPQEKVLFFSDMYFDILVSLISGQSDLRLFVVKDLLRLRKSDQTRNTNYFDTLYQYILCGENINELSRTLFIHRNTAIYRINKAKEFLKNNFDSIEDRMQLYISFKCIQQMDRMQAEREKQDL